MNSDLDLWSDNTWVDPDGYRNPKTTRVWPSDVSSVQTVSTTITMPDVNIITQKLAEVYARIETLEKYVTYIAKHHPHALKEAEAYVAGKKRMGV